MEEFGGPIITIFNGRLDKNSPIGCGVKNDEFIPNPELLFRTP